MQESFDLLGLPAENQALRGERWAIMQAGSLVRNQQSLCLKLTRCALLYY